mmetsp:Transcript_28788/g.82417  ORF Transcript_28788/g.82417 Transcript_28788/m.82417 type:complete len:281 (-) Transcript_28788:134-976(-)
MAGSDLDYGYRPPEVFRPADPWDGQQGWDNKNDHFITGPHGSDIEYGWGTTGIVNTDEEKKKHEQSTTQEAEPETLIRYYVPPKVAHPASRQHKDIPKCTELIKKSSDMEQAAEKEALQELVANPRWQVVRAGEEWRVLRPKGAEGPEPEPHAVGPGTQGVLVIVEPKRIGRAQRYVKELRARGLRQTCVCLVEKSPSCRDPVAVSTMSTALLNSGADEVLMDGWLSYYVNGKALGGYKASLSGRGMVANPVAGNISYQAAPAGYGGANFYGPAGMVSIG